MVQGPHSSGNVNIIIVVVMFWAYGKETTIDLFTDTAATLNSVVSNSYYGRLRGLIGMYLPPEHAIIDI